jgi:hypothetical protein
LFVSFLFSRTVSAARREKVAADVKIGIVVSAVANGPKTVSVYPEKNS